MTKRNYGGSSSLQIDRRTGSMEAKKADIISETLAKTNADIRQGLRDLDEMVERNRKATREQKDAQRGVPRDVTGPIGHPKKDRRLLEPDAVRVPMSKRQRVERLHKEIEVLESLTDDQFDNLNVMTSDPAAWQQMNEGLAANLGDVQNLPNDQIRQIQAVDQAIQAYEATNDRGHRVYTNIKVPWGVNSSNMAGFLNHYLPEGTKVNFDQFTAASHNLNEISDGVGPRTIAVEIHTKRGMFIGEKGDSKSNGHLLPRGLELEVAGFNEVTYSRPDGSRGRRMCVQLLDMTADD